jgi:hypothetical protein
MRGNGKEQKKPKDRHVTSKSSWEAGIQSKGSLPLWEWNHHRADRNTGGILWTVRLKTSVRIIVPSLQSSSPRCLKLNGYEADFMCLFFFVSVQRRFASLGRVDNNQNMDESTKNRQSKRHQLTAF